MKNEQAIKERLEKLQERWDRFNEMLSEHEKGELLGQINAFKWIVEQSESVDPTKQHSKKCPKLFGKECLCDGYHTFEELYDHRIALFIVLCNLYVSVDLAEWGRDQRLVWKSKKHHDNTGFDGWFIAGIGERKGEQLTYHLPMGMWDKLDVLEKARAPKWDGHTPEDVIERLLNLFKGGKI